MTRRTIAAFRLLPALIAALLPAGFWFADPPPVLPFPGLVAGCAFFIAATFAMRRWRRRLTPTATGELRERRCCITGRLRRLDRELVSPWTRRPCLAWLGFFFFSAEGEDEPLGSSVPFVLEPHGGGPVIVIHLANGRGKTRRAWDHLAYGEAHLGPREWSPVDEEVATAFLRPAHAEQARSEGRPPPSALWPDALRPLGEVVYGDGDDVVLEGRFRRVGDTMGVRSGDGLPTYEVVTNVVFAKGPLAVHRRLLSPWLRENVTFFVLGGVAVEMLVHAFAWLLVHGVRW